MFKLLNNGELYVNRGFRFRYYWWEDNSHPLRCLCYYLSKHLLCFFRCPAYKTVHVCHVTSCIIEYQLYKITMISPTQSKKIYKKKSHQKFLFFLMLVFWVATNCQKTLESIENLMNIFIHSNWISWFEFR